MKKSTALSILVIAVLIPATLYLGTRLTGRGYYLTSTLVVLETMLPFLFTFESRHPQPRELVTIAVMAAIAAVSRPMLQFIPHFKPTTAIIMITGIAFGAEAGFLCGALTAFASNFLVGQGPWTPWQMMAYGIGGFLAGALLHRRTLPGSKWMQSVLLGLFGFVTITMIVGPLLDCATLFTTGTVLTSAFALTVFTYGLPVNLIHAAGCALTMLLLGKPLLGKLNRLKRKYGMLEK